MIEGVLAQDTAAKSGGLDKTARSNILIFWTEVEEAAVTVLLRVIDKAIESKALLVVRLAVGNDLAGEVSAKEGGPRKMLQGSISSGIHDAVLFRLERESVYHTLVADDLATFSSSSEMMENCVRRQPPRVQEEDENNRDLDDARDFGRGRDCDGKHGEQERAGEVQRSR